MIHKKIILTAGISLLFLGAFAGNKNRVGQAGAGELLINPWTRSSGMAGANGAFATGLEATHLNVSGLAANTGTEILFSRTNWFSGSGINMNAFGVAQGLGDNGGTIALSVMTMGFGDIEVTTVDNPEGGLGTVTPRVMTFAISYARNFSNSISGGATIKSISESINNAKAGGVCLDMGVKYVTGEFDKLKFGISLKNVGPKMKFEGDGFSMTTIIEDEEFTIEQRSESFELPSLLNIAASYDVLLGAVADSTDETAMPDHRITFAGNFTANSFGKDQVRFGAEYGFKNMFMGRIGYVYEEGIMNVETRSTFNSGLTAGVGMDVPISSSGNKFGIDYSYRFTQPMGGTHSIGVRLNI